MKFNAMRVITLVAGLSMSMLTMAQEKIGVIDIERAMMTSEYAQAQIKAFGERSSFKKLNSEFEALKADLQALEADAQANASKWSNEQTVEFSKKRQYLMKDLEVNQSKVQTEVDLQRKKIFVELEPKATKALEELVSSEGITVLLQKNAVIFASPKHDLTKKLADKLGK